MNMNYIHQPNQMQFCVVALFVIDNNQFFQVIEFRILAQYNP